MPNGLQFSKTSENEPKSLIRIWIGCCLSSSTLKIALIFLLLGCTSNASKVQVQPVKTKPPNDGSITQNRKPIRFVNPPNRGVPGSRRAAASRNDCPATEKDLIALVPESYLGLTISERPTFWFYIPYSSTQELSAEFILQESKTKIAVYRATLPLTETPGIVSVSLPKEAKPLEIEKKYTWIFYVICHPINSYPVQGEVVREMINSKLQSELEEAKSLRDQVGIYAENGLWYDALTTLAQLRIKDPQNKALFADWADLLGSVKLQEIASESLVGVE